MIGREKLTQLVRTVEAEVGPDCGVLLVLVPEHEELEGIDNLSLAGLRLAVFHLIEQHNERADEASATRREVQRVASAAEESDDGTSN